MGTCPFAAIPLTGALCLRIVAVRPGIVNFPVKLPVLPAGKAVIANFESLITNLDQICSIFIV